MLTRGLENPWGSAHFVTSHDGFPRADITAYEQKHNESNGEDNNDGHNENCSRNWGAEGPSDDPAILAARQRVARSLIATLLMALGTPMLLAGDESLRTQNGNNNAYCQDNEMSWIDWERAESPDCRQTTEFVARVIALRKQHPLLRETRFLFGDREVLPGLYDVGWFDEHGDLLTIEAWQDPEGRAFTPRRAGPGLNCQTEVFLMIPTAK